MVETSLEYAWYIPKFNHETSNALWSGATVSGCGLKNISVAVQLCDGPLKAEHMLIKYNHLTSTRNLFYRTCHLSVLELSGLRK